MSKVPLLLDADPFVTAVVTARLPPLTLTPTHAAAYSAAAAGMTVHDSAALNQPPCAPPAPPAVVEDTGSPDVVPVVVMTATTVLPGSTGEPKFPPVMVDVSAVA